jgi:hypothetical protein
MKLMMARLMPCLDNMIEKTGREGIIQLVVTRSSPLRWRSSHDSSEGAAL